MIGRWIQTERSEIGLLKAFGYSTTAITAHYLKLVFAITTVGVVLGFGGGIWLGRGIAVLYQEFFRFPFLHFQFSPSVFAIGAGVSFIAALLGTQAAVRRGARVPPAEAMSPPPPTVYSGGALEGLIKSFTGPSRMIVRHLVRWPLRSGLTILGNACAVGVLIGSMFFMDSMEKLIDVEFNEAQRQDATVSFSNGQGP